MNNIYVMILIIYILGFVITAFSFNGKNAKGQDDVWLHFVLSILWFLVAFFFILCSPILFIFAIRWVKKKIYE